MNEDFSAVLRSFGACDIGCTLVDDGVGGLPFAVSVAVRLSDAIIDEIGPEPTYTYFNHYRSVNFLIDQILLRAGLYLQERGARYITVAASQSRPDSPFEGRYSHKKAACLAGLGSMGRNGLFLHRSWGPRVRLGTLFTDWEGVLGDAHPAEAGSSPSLATAALPDSCTDCGRCVSACPARALDGKAVDVERCSAWMKKAYQHIGRGAVCGLCLQVCPAGRSATAK